MMFEPQPSLELSWPEESAFNLPDIVEIDAMPRLDEDGRDIKDENGRVICD